MNDAVDLMSLMNSGERFIEDSGGQKTQSAAGLIEQFATRDAIARLNAVNQRLKLHVAVGRHCEPHT